MPQVQTRTELIVTLGESPKRLDHFLANREPYLSRTVIQRLILSTHITVGGRAVKPSHKIMPGDRIVLTIPRPEPIEIKPEAIPLDIIYEDESILVLNKRAGFVVHPAPGHWSGTLVHALLYHFQEGVGSLSSIGGKERPGLVHRLDKDTTGIMVVAKNDLAHQALARQFKRHSITRAYEAIVWGSPKRRHGIINLAIGRDIKERKKFSTRTARPKESATTYEVMETFGTMAALVNLFPKTGRTHQLRVHLSAIKCPIIGDPVYGRKKSTGVREIPVPRVMLHAKILGFLHPIRQKEIHFNAPRPSDMEEVIKGLRELA